MKNIFSFLFFLICFQHISHSQCDEYYINELRSGNEGNCKYKSGAKLRFCANSGTISIDAANGRQTFKIIKTDFPDKSTFGTQLFTLAQGGGQVGMAKLIMEDKTFSMQINGCGGSRTYNISLSKSDYNEWVKEKPIRDKEKLEAEKKANEEETRQQKIKTLMEKHNLDAYQKIDTAKVNDLIRDTTNFFGQMLKVHPIFNEIKDEGDSLIIYFDNDGNFEKSNIPISRLLGGYCSDLDRRMEPFIASIRKGNHQVYQSKEYKEIDDEQYQYCQRDHWWQERWIKNYLNGLFWSETKGRDTIIENITIPLKSKLVITFSTKDVINCVGVYAPYKHEGKDLFLLPIDDSFVNNPQYSVNGNIIMGYYTDKNTGNLENIVEKYKFKQQIEYIDKKRVNLRARFEYFGTYKYVNGILVSKNYPTYISVEYVYKKIKQ